MSISASQVKELRERTGAGMMECKKALVEADGDMDAAIETLRKAGAAKADKKAGRTAAEGVAAVATSGDGKSVVVVEVNAETDFVAKHDDFKAFVEKVTNRVLNDKPENVESLLEMSLDNDGNITIKTGLDELVGKIGEKIEVRRFNRIDTDHVVGVYQHGAKISVVVELKGGDEELARDIAMHIAASRPMCIDDSEIPAEVLEKEKEIFMAQAKESGKPDNIIEKMVMGKINKYKNEVTLLGQPFVKDPDTTVGKLLKSKGAEVVSFIRMEVGEGIEKKVENFADEVMSQIKE